MPAPKKKNRRPGSEDDFAKIGPDSLEGVEADDLPGEGRGDVFTDPGKEAKRKLPKSTGGIIGGQSGLRSKPDLVQSDVRGGRKKN